MKIKEFVKKVVEDMKEQMTMRLEFDLELDENCNVVDGGNQRVHVEVIQLK